MDFDMFKDAKDKPPVEAVLTDRHPNAYKRNNLHLRSGSATGRAYSHLKEHKKEAFTVPELSEAIGGGLYTTSLDNIVKKGFIFKSPFMVFTGRTFNSMAYLYSWSEKAIWRRFVSLIPEDVHKALTMIYGNPKMLYSIKELQDATGISYTDAHSWFDKIFIRSFAIVYGKPLLQKRKIAGLRTFYFHPDLTEEEFKAKYEKYYKEEILSQESLSKLRGMQFEEFATWTFVEYMRLKGLKLELTKVDREPCDYIAKLKIDIGDLLVRNPDKELNLAQFVISCKNWNLDRPLSGLYVLGMSGALREGLAFNGEPIFTARRNVGVIICIKAKGRAWKIAIKQGILIVDLDKLLMMYNAVKEKTGQTHPNYERLCLKISAYEDRHKG